MPGPNSLNHWKIAHWTALAKGGFGTVRFLLLQIFLTSLWHKAVEDPLSNHNSEALNCDLMYQRENSDSTAFVWQIYLSSLLLDGVDDCSCWSSCPHSPYHYLHWPTHTILCKDFAHCSILHSMRMEYLTKQCAMQRKTMCNVTEDNTKYKSSTSDSVRADDNSP